MEEIRIGNRRIGLCCCNNDSWWLVSIRDFCYLELKFLENAIHYFDIDLEFCHYKKTCCILILAACIQEYISKWGII